MSNAALKNIILSKQISFVKLLLFEAMMIIEISLRVLGKLNFDPV